MNIKQVIVIRKDINMRRGKEIAQGSHASMAFLTRRLSKAGEFDNGQIHQIPLTGVELAWLDGMFTKVCLQVDSEEQLLEIYEKAKANFLEVHLVTDAGKTEFKGVPTNTCLAIGPDFSVKIDLVTGHLKLY